MSTAVADAAVTSARNSRPGAVNVLLLSTLFKLPYRVLRAAQAAGANIYVLGTRHASGLAYSRYCKEFSLAVSPMNAAFDHGLAEEINRHVERFSIDMVLPGDAPTTRILISITHLITAPCFPMPDLKLFDLLNDKWQFSNLCESVGLRCPKTSLFQNTDDLRRHLDGGSLEFPLVAKPLSLDGGAGFMVLRRETARRQLSTIFYHPVVVQDFIPGEDISASVYCEQGEILAFIAHKYGRSKYTAFFHEGIFGDISRLMHKIEANGVLNFDMREAPDGRVFYVECNPRFYFNIANSYLVGINFVAPGLPNADRNAPNRLSRPATVLFPKAMLATFHKPWKLKGTIASALNYIFDDPLPYFRESFGLGEDAGRSFMSQREE